MSVGAQNPYPTAGAVMNRARAFVNDAFRGGAGRILTNQAPFSVEYLNAALEELQDKIGNNGVITLIKDNVILGPIPALSAADPTLQISIAYTGFYNGTSWTATPALPSDCRAVLRVWEQQIGSGLPFQDMQQSQDGLPSAYQTQYLNTWEYRGDAIWMIGSTTQEQIRIRYESRFNALPADSSQDDWNSTEISILSSVNALATIVAYNYARARGTTPEMLQVMAADSEKMMRYIVRRYTRRAQTVPYRRNPYGWNNGTDGSGLYYTNLPF